MSVLNFVLWDFILQIAEKTIERTRKAQEESEFKLKQTQAEIEAEQKLSKEIEKLQINHGEYRPPVSVDYLVLSILKKFPDF